MKSFTDRCNAAVTLADRLATVVTNWADYSNAFSAPGGYMHVNFPSDAERQRFCETPQYAHVMTVLEALMHKFGVAQGGKPTIGPSGRPMIMV